MTQIFAIRPEPGLTSTVALGRTLGLAITGEPLFEIRPVPWVPPDPDTIDALLIGSANAFAHGGPQLGHLTEKPVYAVGKATAEAASTAGFVAAHTGSGGLQNVLDTISAPTRLLRLAGADHVALTPPVGVEIHMSVVYESARLAMPPAMTEALRGEALILLHSAVAAEHFAKECGHLALDRAQMSLAVLGPRIAEAAGDGWREVRIAPAPNDRALLEMVREQCIEM